MTPEVWQHVREILDAVLLVPAEKRPAYLDEACAGDADLRHEVESLIDSYERAGDTFLEGRAIDAAGFDASRDQPLEGQRIGPYRVVEEIGHGGMGVVYRAVRADDQFRKEVAIKVVRGGLNNEASDRRFKAERQILANLDHPYIARLLDGGAVDGRPFVVMEYVQGVPIDEYCDSHRMPVRARLELFRKVCSAVAYAHQHLVVHRDIKPGNILVTADGQPKLLDFGIAKILDPAQNESANPTVTMMLLMTPEYASPEQMRGEAITTATDVYSLGVVLYGLLTGRRPYRTTGRLPHEMARAVLEQEPERPSASLVRADAASTEAVTVARATTPDKLKRQLRGDLDNIVLKAIRKEPDRRYVSAEQLSEDIRRHTDGLPVTARPDTFSYRSGKFVRRHKAAVIAAAMVLLALLGGIAATLRQAAIARTERARAEQRFYDVRQLANSLLFEVHDAIENLPGSTPARKILVERALQYLDKLAKEAKGDQSLQRELAAAYEKVGDVQGGYRSSNLGDFVGFISSYKKALAIRQAVYEAEPSNVEAQRELLRTHGRLSDALIAQGDLAGSLDQLRQLLPIAERLASADPKNLADQRNLALAHLDYGWKSSGTADWQAGLTECRKAAAMLEQIAAADPNDKRTQRVLAVAYGRVGELLSQNAHQHADALAMSRKALAVETALVAGDPRNTDLQRLQGWEMLRIGEENFALRDTAAAVQHYDAALDKFRALSKADPKNAQFRFDVASAKARLGALHLETDQVDAGVKELQESLADLDASSNRGAPNTDQLELIAMNQYRVAVAYDRLASEQGISPAQRARYQSLAETWYTRSMPSLEEAASHRALQRDEEHALEDARKGQARIRAVLAPPASNRP
ncbi:MAG TPA: protein kinase [Bryobacteraceae bacterium]|nr:protein kinase [Bryobacteraceae bacterium]